jgi:hypothetical protein
MNGARLLPPFTLRRYCRGSEAAVLALHEDLKALYGDFKCCINIVHRYAIYTNNSKLILYQKYILSKAKRLPN